MKWENDDEANTCDKCAWELIKGFIPKHERIRGSDTGDGQSGKILSELGFNVIREETGSFKNNVGDIVVSNPPFSKKHEVMTRLKELDKPFIIICPNSMMNMQNIRQLLGDYKLQITIQHTRIDFKKVVDCKNPGNWGYECNYCIALLLGNRFAY